jgi:hypothetical protein
MAVLIGLVSADNARANGFDIIPSIAVKEEYNDNIFVTQSGEIDDYITTLSPGIELEQRTARLNLRLSGRMDGLIYTDNDDLNHIDQNYSGRVHYQLTPRMGGGFEAGYLRDSRPDRDIPTTGLVLGTDIRHRMHFRAFGDYALTEKTATAISYAYSKEEFDEAPLSDFSSHTVDIGFTHNLETVWKSTLGRMNLGYTIVDYTISKIDNYSATLGIERRLSEFYQFIFDIGPRFTRTEFDIPWVDTSEVWGVRGQISLTYGGEYTNIRLNFSHDVQPASGRTGATERTGLSTNIGRRFSDKFRGDLSASYYLNKSDQAEFTLSNIDENSLRIQPRLRYNFTRDMALEAYYAYTIIHDQVTDTERAQNSVYIRFTLRYPLLRP